MGQRAPDHLEGVSLRAQVEGAVPGVERDVVIEWTPDDGDSIGPDLPAHAAGIGTAEEINASLAADLRTLVTPDGWKYTWSSAGEDTLYDLTADPLEMRECGHDPAQHDRIAAMRGGIRVWQKRTADRAVLHPDTTG
jgi:hypothetical protein